MDRAQCAAAKDRGCVFWAPKRLCYSDKGSGDKTDYDKTDYDETDYDKTDDEKTREPTPRHTSPPPLFLTLVKLSHSGAFDLSLMNH